MTRLKNASRSTIQSGRACEAFVDLYLTIIIDTNIAIRLRDGEPATFDRIAALGERFAISVVTQIELEGGVDRIPALAARRRRKLDELVAEVTVLPFGSREAEAYGRIVAAVGYVRGHTLDRMIAATALVHDAELHTLNARDFRAVPLLKLIDWSTAQP